MGEVGGWVVGGKAQTTDKETNTGGGEGVGGLTFRSQLRLGLVSYSGGRGFSKKPLTAPKSNPLKVF